MSRKSRETVAIEENVAKIASLEDQIRTLRAVNDALEAIAKTRRTLAKETA